MDFQWTQFNHDGRFEFSGSLSRRDISALRLSRVDYEIIDHASEAGANPHSILLALSLIYLRHTEQAAEKTPAAIALDQAQAPA
jgi:hypothetical protein